MWKIKVEPTRNCEQFIIQKSLKELVKRGILIEINKKQENTFNKERSEFKSG